MNSRRILPIAAAWFATAAIAFSLGRIGSTTRESGSARQSSPPTQETSAVFPSRAESGGSAEEFSLANWFGSRATDLKAVLGAKSLEDHVKHLLAQEDEATRMLGFLRLLEALESGEDFKGVLEIIAKDPNGRFRMTEQAMLLQKWAKTDPKAAAAYAGAMRDYTRFNGLNAVLRTWLKTNSEEAIAWAVENGVQSGSQSSRGPSSGDEGNWAVAMLLGSLAKTDLDRAMQVASEQPYSRARGRMVDTLVNELVSQRGEEAARNAVLDLPDDAFRAGLAGRVAERIAGKNPEAAATWANGLPAGETRERALAQAVSEWADRDAAAAGTYLKSLGSSPVRIMPCGSCAATRKARSPGPPPSPTSSAALARSKIFSAPGSDVTQPPPQLGLRQTTSRCPLLQTASVALVVAAAVSSSARRRSCPPPRWVWGR